MIKKQISVFLLRWLASSFGMFIVIRYFGSVDQNIHSGVTLYILSGLIFSLVNSIVRPLTTLFSLPLIIFTMGLFTLVINILMMALAIWLTPGVHVEIPGIIIGTIILAITNWLMNFSVISRQSK
jgi:putative membrane protein